MQLPAISGCIERRILVNFRLDPEALARLLPAPFRPHLVNGAAVGGICLIRLSELRPRGWPARLGLRSENAAHRFAVEWDGPSAPEQGVYIPRRDTDSDLNAALGGRFFPGLHHRADFTVRESPPAFQVALRSHDDATVVQVSARIADQLPADSLFNSLAEASDFFRCGALGYSPSAASDSCEGLELHCGRWAMEPLAVDAVHSSFFADRARFPAGSAVFDSALLMRDIPHDWLARGTLPIQFR